MKIMTDQDETDFVNAYLDKTVAPYRETLRAVALSQMTAKEGAAALARLIKAGLEELQTDPSNSVGVSLAYELSQSIRCEINSGGRPYRLDRPRSTMMRTPMMENARKTHGFKEPLLHFVSTSFFYLGGHKGEGSPVGNSLEALGADRIHQFLDSLDIWPEVIE
jgi:hypothetical protein